MEKCREGRGDCEAWVEPQFIWIYSNRYELNICQRLGWIKFLGVITMGSLLNTSASMRFRTHRMQFTSFKPSYARIVGGVVVRPGARRELRRMLHALSNLCPACMGVRHSTIMLQCMHRSGVGRQSEAWCWMAAEAHHQWLPPEMKRLNRLHQQVLPVWLSCKPIRRTLYLPPRALLLSRTPSTTLDGSNTGGPFAC